MLRQPNQRVEMADILREGMDVYHSKYGPLPIGYYKIINALTACRTSALQGHINRCDHCGHEEISYNSCRNRHCPKCQGSNSYKWVQSRVDELLPVPYFHVVFTVPSQLNAVAIRNKEAFYRLLFTAVSATLREMAQNPKHLGVEIGFFCVLHTWGQNLLDHPHIHCVVPGGGLTKNRTKWKHAKRKYLFPVKAMASLFRGKFLACFRTAVEQGVIRFIGKTDYLLDPKQYQDFLSTLYHKQWVAYAKAPFAGPEQVVKYLSRYTHRIAISNHRILSMENEKVSFQWRDYSDANKTKVMTLNIAEFIRRFLLHFLPKGFVRIRYFGLMGNRVRREVLQLCRNLLGKLMTKALETIGATPSVLRAFTLPLCPRCGIGHLVADFASPVMPPG